MSGNISIDSSNIVNLAGSSKITVTGALTGTTPAVVIKPASYNVAQQIITCSASDGTTLAKVVNAGYFGVSKNGTDLWAVAENGYLVTQYSTYFNQGVSYEASPADDKICGVVLLVKTDADNTYGTGGTVVYKNMSEDNDYGIEVGYEDNHPLPASWISGDQSDSPSESTDYSGWRPIKALLNSDANYTSCEGYYLKYYIKDLSGSYAPCFASEDDGADVWASSDGAQWDRKIGRASGRERV